MGERLYQNWKVICINPHFWPESYKVFHPSTLWSPKKVIFLLDKAIFSLFAKNKHRQIYDAGVSPFSFIRRGPPSSPLLEEALLPPFFYLDQQLQVCKLVSLTRNQSIYVQFQTKKFSVSRFYFTTFTLPSSSDCYCKVEAKFYSILATIASIRLPWPFILNTCMSHFKNLTNKWELVDAQKCE